MANCVRLGIEKITIWSVWIDICVFVESDLVLKSFNTFLLAIF